jgi:hypothetical protein
MRRENDKENNNDPEVNPYDFYQGVNIGSQTECTGMIPTPPMNEVQQEGYHDIYSVPQQCSVGAREKKDAKEQKRKSSVRGEKDIPLE